MTSHLFLVSNQFSPPPSIPYFPCFDTLETFTDRIAWALNSLPEYVVYTPTFTLEEIPYEINCVNLLYKLQNYRGNNDKLIELYTSGAFPPELISNLFYNIYGQNVPTEVELILQYKNISTNYQKTTIDYNSDVNIYRQQQDKIIGFYQYLFQTPDYSTSPFIVSKEEYRWELIPIVPLSFLFNDLRVSADFPYIQYKDFNKFYKKVTKTTVKADTSLVIHTKDKKEIITVENIDEILTVGFITKANTNPDFTELFGDYSLKTLSLGIIQGELNVVALNMVFFSDFLLNTPMVNQYIAIKNTSLLDIYDSRIIKYMYSTYFIQCKAEYLVGRTVFTIQGNSSTAVSFFICFLTKILTIYYSELPNIRQLYDQLNVDTNTTQKLNIIMPTMALEKLFPKDGSKTYTRECQKSYTPVIALTNEEPLDAVMSFPTAEDSIKYGIPIYNYTCKNPNYPFIGLKEYQQGLIQFIPCCFKKETKNSPNMNAYYRKIEKNKKTTGYTLKTGKYLLEGQVGRFSKPLNRLFHAGEERVGMPEGGYSILYCLSLALNKSIPSREELYSTAHIAIASQENPGMSPSEIENLLLYPDTASGELRSHATSLNPRKFIRILEHYYQCRIILLDKNGFLLPNGEPPYVMWEFTTEFPTVVVYYQPEIDKWELIRGIAPLLLQNVIILYQRYCELWGFVNNTQTLSRVSLDKIQLTPRNWFNICTGQWIDSKGKCRCLFITFNGVEMEWTTTPIPPLNLPVRQKSNIVADLDVIKDFVNTYRLSSPVRTTYTYMVTSGVITMTHLHARIPIQTCNRQVFLLNERMARYITNWFIYLFSQYYSILVDTPVEQAIVNFKEKYCTINPDWTYSLLDRNFSTENQSKVQTLSIFGKRFVCTSEKLLTKLTYQLLLLCKRNHRKVIEFHTRNYLENYYLKATDFEQMPDEIITEGSYVQELFQENIQRERNNTFTNSYFIRVQNQVWLTNNEETLQDALIVSYNWVTQGVFRQDYATIGLEDSPFYYISNENTYATSVDTDVRLIVADKYLPLCN